jgi:Domain of unknown function (DUF5047)
VPPWPTSQQFRQTIAGDHELAVLAEVLVDGLPAAVLSDLGVVEGGAVDVAATEIRRTLTSFTVVDQSGELAPRRGGDLLVPAGHELRLWRGCWLADGSGSELAPLGVFRFTSSSDTYPRVELRGYDRAWVIQGAKLEAPLTIPAGTNYIDAVVDVLRAAWGQDLPVNFPSTDETTATMAFELEADPWQIAQELAANLGMDLYFDPLGVCTMSPFPDPAVVRADWVFDEGDLQNLALPGLALDWDITDAVNAVVVIGENSENPAPVLGRAVDNDPNSPTRYDGPVGHRPVFIRDEKAKTKSQATSRARKELARRLGIPQRGAIPSLVNPAMDAGDTLLVNSPSRGFGQLFIADRFTVPLRANQAMQVDTRARQVTTL